MPDDIKKLAKTLRLLSSTEFSAATAATINRIATAANGGQRLNIQREFKLRNKFTLGSLMMFKASPKKDADKIDALVGSKSPYLPEQETGGMPRTRRNKPAVSMPTKKARGGNWGKPVGARFRMDKIRSIGHRGSGGRMTPKGTPFFFLEGGRLKNKTMFERRGRRLIRVRVITHGPIKLKATHWHTEAMAKFGKPSLMAKAWQLEINKSLTKLGAK